MEPSALPHARAKVLISRGLDEHASIQAGRHMMFATLERDDGVKETGQGFVEYLSLADHVTVELVFGKKQLRNIGTDLGGAVKSFKEGMKDAETPADTQSFK